MFAVIDAFLEVIPSDEWGPVVSVMDMALGVALSFLAVRRPGRAGKLLTDVALLQFVAIVVNVVMHETGALPPGPGLGNPLVVLWMLVVGVLFRLAETSERSPATRHMTA